MTERSVHYSGDPADMTAADWNNGLCDVMAVAMSRRYGLPMLGAFERRRDGSTGFLAHAFCALPDGRMVDAAGPAAMLRPEECSSGDDPEVDGFVIVPTGPELPNLATLARFDYDREIRLLRAAARLERHLDGAMAAVGIAPARGLPFAGRAPIVPHRLPREQAGMFTKLLKSAKPKSSSAARRAALCVSFAPLAKDVEVPPYTFGGIESDRSGKAMTAERMIGILEEVVAKARAETAARMSAGRRKPVKPEQLVVAAVDLVPESVGLRVDAPSVRYFCNGIHPDDGGGWSDWAYGVTDQEAEFHALWMMALNGEDYPPSDPDDFSSFVGAMMDSKIDYMVPEPVTKDELAAAAARLVAEVGASTGEAYDEVVEMLGKLGVKVESRSPRMMFLTDDP